MKSIHWILMILVLSVSACQEHTLAPRSNKITKLSFATGGCYGECPMLAFEVDSSLNYKFYGGRYSSMEGNYKGKISQSLWDTINSRFEQLQTRNLDTTISSVDDQSFEIILHFGTSRIYIQKQEQELPKDVRDDLYWLLESYKKVALGKVNAPMIFETLIQNGPPSVPPPPIED